MKKILLFFIGLNVFSCGSDDDTSTEPEVINTLILKQITNTSQSGLISTSHFNTSGRLDSIINLNITNDVSKTIFTYNSDNKLINEATSFFTESVDDYLEYQNSQLSTIGRIGLASTYNTSIEVNNSTLSYFIPGYDFTLPVSATVSIDFKTDALQYASGYSITFPEPNFNTPIYRVADFEYDTSNNIISVHFSYNNGNLADDTILYSYDNKKNPFAESMSEHRLNYVIITSYYGVSTTKLYQLSENNILSLTNDQGLTFNYDYEYNTDNYPVSATVTNTSSNEVTNSITYTYY